MQEKLFRDLEERKERQKRENELQICEICQMTLFDEESSPVFTIGNCSDVYHQECILNWLS